MSPLEKERPLIPESLVRLYRRMAEAWRSPAPAEAVAIAKLSRLVELYHRAAATLESAVARSDADQQDDLRQRCREASRLAASVGELVTELGGSPPRPSESALELPRGARAMQSARNQAELMGFVQEDLDYLAAAHVDLASLPELPPELRQRLGALGTTPARLQ